MTTAREDPEALYSAMTASADRRALARLLTMAESESSRFAPIADRVAAELVKQPRRALRVGITGQGGAGKSTLIDALVRELRSRGETVAVLATDPTSERSGGALLGDRIRFAQENVDAGVFFRSVATRGAAGGLAHAGFDQLDLLDRFGFAWILIEAVGAGQSEIEVAFAADVTMVCVPPESGDAVQALKAGLMEAGDLFCVTKADLPAADATATTLRATLELEPRDEPGSLPPPPVWLTSARTGRGIRELPGLLADRAAAVGRTGEGERRRRARLERRVRHLVLRAVEQRLLPLFPSLLPFNDASPHRAAREMLSRLLR